MLGLSRTDAPASTFSLSAGTTSNQLPDSPELQRLGELLQETYAHKIYSRVLNGQLRSAIQLTTSAGICPATIWQNTHSLSADMVILLVRRARLHLCRFPVETTPVRHNDHAK